MQSVMADFVQFFSAIAKFSFLKGRLSKTSALNFEVFFKFHFFLKSYVIQVPGDNNLVPFHLRWREGYFENPWYRF